MRSRSPTATISSGTLSLNVLGTTTTNFFYEFPNGFTVGARRNDGRRLRTCRSRWSRRSIDAGKVTFASGDQVTLFDSASSVSGSLTANGTTFVNEAAAARPSRSPRPRPSVAAPTPSTCRLSFPTRSSLRWQAIPASMRSRSPTATISSGTLSLNLLGTITTNFFYEFPNGFTVAAGGTMAVGCERADHGRVGARSTRGR